MCGGGCGAAERARVANAGPAVRLCPHTHPPTHPSAHLPTCPPTHTLCAGAMTFCFIQSIQQGQGATYNTLFRACRIALKFGPQHFTQVPQLTTSHRFDLNRKFVL